MTDEEKLEILKKICIENICCKDCKALGIYDDCKSPRILKCKQLIKGVVEEVFSNLEKENEQLKKNAIVWHKQDVDDIYNTFKDWSVHKYLCRMKDGSLNIAMGSVDENYNGDFGININFEINDEKYYIDDIEAWAELSELAE